jgi:hypothetical protein
VRLLVAASLDFDGPFGYQTRSISHIPRVEIPFGNRFEFQSKSSYSPGRLLLTDNGNELNVTGSAIFWATMRFGLTANYSRGWL